jgi:two-component system, cell cycle sensor histidine kinase and response regulator CckA
VAHDFKNLLGVILGHTRLLRESLADGGPFHRGLSQIEQAAESAAALTRQLLAYSRQQVLQPRLLDLNDVLVGVEPLIKGLIGEHIDFQTALGPQLYHLQADPGQIEQVIMNLAINARDAMPEGGKLIIEISNVEVDEAYHQERPMVALGQSPIPVLELIKMSKRASSNPSLLPRNEARAPALAWQLFMES